MRDDREKLFSLPIAFGNCAKSRIQSIAQKSDLIPSVIHKPFVYSGLLETAYLRDHALDTRSYGVANAQSDKDAHKCADNADHGQPHAGMSGLQGCQDQQCRACRLTTHEQNQAAAY